MTYIQFSVYQCVILLSRHDEGYQNGRKRDMMQIRRRKLPSYLPIASANAPNRIVTKLTRPARKFFIRELMKR